MQYKSNGLQCAFTLSIARVVCVIVYMCDWETVAVCARASVCVCVFALMFAFKRCQSTQAQRRMRPEAQADASRIN